VPAEDDMLSCERLEIFIDQSCPNYKFNIDHAKRVRNTYPELSVRVIDINNRPEQIPKMVFAVPTYLLNGKMIFLGNPTQQELRTYLEKKEYLVK
jgi:hypothetical protein